LHCEMASRLARFMLEMSWWPRELSEGKLKGTAMSCVRLYFVLRVTTVNSRKFAATLPIGQHLLWAGEQRWRQILMSVTQCDKYNTMPRPQQLTAAKTAWNKKKREY